MTPLAPILHSLDAEESLVAASLLHDDHAGLAECADSDIWLDHLRPIVATIRRLHATGQPIGTVFVLHELEATLDEIEWRGDRGEVVLLDLLARRAHDPQAWYGRGLGTIVRHYAEQRQAVQSGQREALLAVRAARPPKGPAETIPEGFIDD